MKYASNRCNSELLKKKKKCLFNILRQSQQLNPTENVKEMAALHGMTVYQRDAYYMVP